MSTQAELAVPATPRRAALTLAAAGARHALTALRGLYWYLEGILGADAYAHYLSHHRASRCTSEPMTERDFWRDKFDRQDRNPEGRCC